LIEGVRAKRREAEQSLDPSLVPPSKRPRTKDDDEEEGERGESRSPEIVVVVVVLVIGC